MGMIVRALVGLVWWVFSLMFESELVCGFDFSRPARGYVLDLEMIFSCKMMDSVLLLYGSAALEISLLVSCSEHSDRSKTVWVNMGHVLETKFLYEVIRDSVSLMSPVSHMRTETQSYWRIATGFRLNMLNMMAC